ncbi:unnamed protein product [Diatraea saccharalis]|uniref:Chitin-binding type-2 domain-containing protein n=1 Tax=Diatraea saccharalis TaxID=40085 RepID=A0A9N9R747_9NEOP|nr:unnamed protein product [Diatraea saccharalis]
MKYSALTLLSAFALATARHTSNDCPNDSNTEKLLPHRNCNRFYKCSNGKLVPLTCPSKLYFSIEQNRCEWAEKVNCDNREVPDGNDNSNNDETNIGGGNCDPSLAPEICAADGSNDVMVANQNCNQFYICANGQPIVLTCPDNLFFNPNTDRCDWPNNVDCDGRLIPENKTNESDDTSYSDESDDSNDSDDSDDNGDDNESCAGEEVVGGGNGNPNLAPEICSAEGSNDVLVAHENCNQFYICANGKPVAKSCPANLLFNPNTDRCEWRKCVDCGNRVVPDDDCSENDNNSSGGESDESIDSNDSDDNDDNGEDNESCAGEEVVGGGNGNPNLAPEICSAEGSNDVLVAHENCNQFYICANGKPVAKSCPANLLFNPNTDRCEWRKCVDCGNRVVPDDDCSENDNNSSGGESDESIDSNDSDDNDDNGEDNESCAGEEVVGGGNGNPNLAPEICSAEGSNDVLVAHENCNQFYICANGKPVAKSCPTNLLFNPNTDRCEWRKCVDCGNRVVPDDDCSENDNNSSGGESDESIDSNDSDDNDDNGEDNESCAGEEVVGGGNGNPNLAPEICSAEGSNDVLVAHENCNQFYICANGKPVAKSCPANLLFNPNTDRCEWRKCVDCGNRVVPDDDCSENDNNSSGGESDESIDSNDSDDNDDNGEDNESCAGEEVVGGGNGNPNLAPEICSAEGSNDVLVAHENCNQFYICANGKPVAKSCPANLLFNPNTDRCEWRKCVDCGNRVVPDDDCSENDNNSSGGESDESIDSNDSDDNDDNGEDNESCAGEEVVGGGNGNPNLAPEICSAEGSNDVLVAHENCNQFYICANGKPVAKSCPANLLFNPNTDRCEWRKCVDCGNRVVPDDDCSENDNNSSGGESDESIDSNDSDDNDDNGEDNESCAGEEVVGGGNGNPNLAPEICSAEGSNDVLVAHENCNQFYICANGKPVAKSCPANLLFNPNTDRCEWRKCVDCGNRVVPDDDCSENDNNSSGGESDESIDSNDSDDNDDNGEDNESCAGEEVVGGGNGNPNLAPEICSAEGSNDILVAHENCNQFYICANGKPVAKSCPANLLFNPNTDRCEWRKCVDCGNRVVPDDDCSENDNNSSGGESIDSNDSDDNDDNGEDNESCAGKEVVGGGNGNPNLAPEICSAEGSNDVLVAHENCNQFYICANGKPVAKSCPANLLFNPNTDRCEWRKCVDCGNRVVPDDDCSENDNNSSGGESDGSIDSNDSDDNDDNGEDNESCAGEEVLGGGNGNPNLAPEICSAEGSNDVLVAHENCNQFYICANGKPVAKSCPANLLFNPNTDRCEWRKCVDCGNRVVPDDDCSENDNNSSGGESDESIDSNDSDDNDDNGEDNESCAGEEVVRGGNGNPNLAPEICSAEGSNDVLVAHENCNQFYICANGKPVAKSCPANLLFNPNTDRCEWRKCVDCGNRVVPDDDFSENDNNSSGGESDESIDSNDSDDNDDNGEDNESCAGEEVVGGGNGNPNLAPEICSAEGSNDVLVAHENCNQFYICANGKPVAKSCPANLLFNPNTDRCEWRKCVDCGNRVVPDDDCSENDNNSSGGESDESIDSNDSDDNDDNGEDNESCAGEEVVGGGNGNPNLAPEICSAEGSNDVLVAHENCNQFYICANGKPVAKSCPANLLFNPNTDRYEWRKCVDCGNRVVPDDDCSENDNNSSGGESDESIDSNDSDDNDDNGEDNESCAGEEVVGGGNGNPNLAPEICSAEGSNDVLVAHENCNQFYICANGKPVAKSCPANLLFNPNTDRCEWRKCVDCGDRVTPDDGCNENENSSSENEVKDDNGDDSSCEDDDDEKDKKCAAPTGEVSNDDPSQASAICASENSDGFLIAHENCGQFYICDHNKPVTMDCPTSLLFNPYSGKCDWSHCVVCGAVPVYSSFNKHFPARLAFKRIR